MATNHDETLLLGSGLLDLPNELLIEILISISADFAKTLWSVSLVCKQLRNIVELYMEPKYNIRGSVMGDPFAFTQRIAKKPLLQSVIRSMSITPSFASQVERTPEEVNELVGSLDLQEFYKAIPFDLGTKYNSPAFGLAFLPQLETLDIKSDPTIAHYHPSYHSTTAHEHLSFFGDKHFKPTDLKTHAFCNLVNLNLLFRRKDNVAVRHGKMFQLPNLRKVCLSNIDFRLSPFYVPQGSSPVIELHLLDLSTWQNNMPGSHVFSLFQGLEILHLNFRYWRDLYHFIPNRYYPVLYAVRHSLKSLEVYNKPRRAKHDKTSSLAVSTTMSAPSCMSLSFMPDWSPMPYFGEFRSLKCLSFTDEALGSAPLSSPKFCYSSTGEVLARLSEVFPKSLESFTHILWEGSYDDSTRTLDDRTQWRSWDRIWAASARQQFPSLKRVETVSYGFNGINNDRRLIWERK